MYFFFFFASIEATEAVVHGAMPPQEERRGRSSIDHKYAETDWPSKQRGIRLANQQQQTSLYSVLMAPWRSSRGRMRHDKNPNCSSELRTGRGGEHDEFKRNSFKNDNNLLFEKYRSHKKCIQPQSSGSIVSVVRVGGRCKGWVGLGRFYA